MQRTRVRNGLLNGRVLNLGLGGLAFESTTGLRVGSQHGFRLVYHDRAIAIEARVRWCRLRRTVRSPHQEVVAIFQTGLSFTKAPKLFTHSQLRTGAEWLDPVLQIPE